VFFVVKSDQMGRKRPVFSVFEFSFLFAYLKYFLVFLFIIF